MVLWSSLATAMATIKALRDFKGNSLVIVGLNPDMYRTAAAQCATTLTRLFKMHKPQGSASHAKEW